MSIQALREQRAAKAQALREFTSKKDWKKDRDMPVYDQMLADVDEIDSQIKAINAANERYAAEQSEGRVVVAADRMAHDKKSEGARIFAKWARGGMDALNAEERKTVRNTMSTTTPSEGGFTVQTDVANRIVDTLRAFGGMRSVANILRTTQGNPMQFPGSDGTAETGELIGQNAPATGQDIAFTARQLLVYKYSSKICACPIELLQDSESDMEAFIINRLATRIGRITNTHFTVGTGTNQPQGVVTGASIGVTAASGSSQVTSVTYASLVALVHSVDPAYRAIGNCGFMMSDAALRQIRLVVDGQQRPIFQPGYEQGPPGSAPDRILGYPVTLNQDVPAMAASARSIVFGDFSAYTIRDTMDVTMFRFTDSAYTQLGQVGFLAWMRSGGNIIDTGALRVFVNAAT
jgi:HK97 family phage major capsid protein